MTPGEGLNERGLTIGVVGLRLGWEAHKQGRLTVPISPAGHAPGLVSDIPCNHGDHVTQPHLQARKCHLIKLHLTQDPRFYTLRLHPPNLAAYIVRHFPLISHVCPDQSIKRLIT